MASEYLVSARKYRPEAFDSLLGQDNIAKTLKNSILRGQLAHAYLFCGPRGVGKTTTARIFAKMINCSNPSAEMEPCGECESCRSFAEGRSYCIHELDAASNNGVDDIKALIDQVRIPPQVGRYSVYIIDEVHMLSQAAFNAFLKTLEEPPSHAIFILATTEKHKILPTILSRCQTYDFNRIGVDDMVRNLKNIAAKENITIDEQALHVIARKADGAMRDALTIFDQCVAFCGTDVKYEDVLRNLAVLGFETTFTLVDDFLAGNYTAVMLKLDEILAKGFNGQYFMGSISEHLRNLAVTKAGGMESLLELPENVKQQYAEQAARCTMKFIYDALALTTQCEATYKASINPRLHMEFTLMRLCYLRGIPAETQPAAPVAPMAPVAPVVSAPVSAPAPTPEAPAASAAPAPAAPVAPAAPATPKSALNLAAILGTDKQEAKVEETLNADVPDDDTLKEKWQEFASSYSSRQNLYNTLSKAKLEIDRSNENDVKVTFFSPNELNTKIIRERFLFNFNDQFKKLIGTRKVSLYVDTVPPEEVENKAYTPQEQLAEMAQANPEIKNLMDDTKAYFK